MESSVTDIIAELVMQSVEEEALERSPVKMVSPLCRRFERVHQERQCCGLSQSPRLAKYQHLVTSRDAYNNYGQE